MSSISIQDQNGTVNQRNSYSTIDNDAGKMSRFGGVSHQKLKKINMFDKD